jgi:hypothetical protein
MWTNADLSTKSGSFTGGSYNPGPWYYFSPPTGFCVYAEAHYSSYPSVSDSSLVCQY